MALTLQDASSGDNGATKIAACELSPLIIPGTFFFGLYDDQGLKVEGGFEVENFVLSKHMPLVSQDFADKPSSSRISNWLSNMPWAARYEVLDQLRVSSDSRPEGFTLGLQSPPDFI